jgi:hypothetical protein
MEALDVLDQCADDFVRIHGHTGTPCVKVGEMEDPHATIRWRE